MGDEPAGRGLVLRTKLHRQSGKSSYTYAFSPSEARGAYRELNLWKSSQHSFERDGRFCPGELEPKTEVHPCTER